MQALCLNCDSRIPEHREFCENCEEQLDQVVDSKNFETSHKVERDDRVNPFGRTTGISGRIQSDDEETVEAKLSQDEAGGSGYWLFILLVVFVAGMMLLVFL